VTGEQRYTWSEWLEAELAAARRESVTLREAARMLSADIARCPSDQIAALGLNPAWFHLRAVLAASPDAEEPQPRNLATDRPPR
jgi:hypothetical protein